MNYVFFGNNVPLAERLRKALGTGVIECITLLQMKNTLLPAEEMDYCVFIEKTDPTLNIPAIMHLHKTFQNIYIVLIAPEMTREEKISYLQAGTDCVISESTSKEDLVKLLGIAEKCKRMEKAHKPQIKEPDLAIFKLPLWKRVFDIIFSSMALLCLSPIFIITVIWIKLEDKGPAFYKSKRVGSNYKVFDFYKFRSMYMDAEERKKELESQNEMNGFMFKMKDDPRITKVGKFIRKTSIDELPQFYNVLKGDMSLVGTRPPTVDEFRQYESHQKRRLSAKPGITGLWQVSGRNEIKDFEDVVKLDVQYIDNWSIGLDIKIILKTIKVVFEKGGE